MKKVLSVFLAALMVALLFTPAFAADDTYNVTFIGPSAQLNDDDAYTYYKSVNGEFENFVLDPDGGYGYYSVDDAYYYLDDLTDKSREVFDNAAPGTPEYDRYSPAKWENCTVEAGSTVSFRVITDEVYDVKTVRVFCNGEQIYINNYGEFAVVADQDLTFSVAERDINGDILLRNNFAVVLTSGEGYAAKPVLDENYHAVYYGDSFRFRVRLSSGYSGEQMTVKVVRGDSMLSEFLGEDADMLDSIIGNSETLRSTGVDSEGCRTYRIDNVTSNCKVLISGVNKESSSGILAIFKRILRLLLGLLGIDLGEMLGEDKNPLASYTVTLNDNLNGTGISYTTNHKFAVNAETGNNETEVLKDECVMIVVTKQRENQNVNVTWTPRENEDYTVNWQAYYDAKTQKTTWQAVWYIDGINADTTIKIIAS